MSSAKFATRPHDRDTDRSSQEMIFVGQRCHHDDCSLVDFLPLKCQYCSEPFCSTHFLASSHACPKLPPSYSLDRIAPLCPLCSTPISTYPGQDPNGPMEVHIAQQCRGAQDKEEEMKKKRQEGRVCWRKSCGKVLIAKIKCESCDHSFCPSHRHPKDHHCSSLASGSGTGTGTGSASSSANASRSGTPVQHKFSNPSSAAAGFKTNTSKLFSNVTSSLSKSTPSSSSSSSSPSASASASSGALKEAKARARFEKEWNQSCALPAGPKRDAALAALRRQNPILATQLPMTSPSASSATRTASKPPPSNTSPAATKPKLPFTSSTSDKRAKAEWESSFKSLQNRANKGLLNETEKVKYAEMVAMKERARRGVGGGGKKEDCTIA